MEVKWLVRIPSKENTDPTTYRLSPDDEDPCCSHDKPSTSKKGKYVKYEKKEGDDEQLVEIRAKNGSVKVPRAQLIRFSLHFKRLFLSEMQETKTCCLELHYSIETVDQFVHYMNTGEIPLDVEFEELCALYGLANYLLHGPLEAAVAQQLIHMFDLNSRLDIMEVAMKDTTGILYKLLVDYLSQNCDRDWFIDRVNMDIFLDILKRDDLDVYCEDMVVEMINNWLAHHKARCDDKSLEKFAGVVRCQWLSADLRRQLQQYSAAFVLPAAPDPPALDESLMWAHPRNNYLKHLHFAVVESVVNELENVELFELSKGLCLPRYPGPPRMHNHLALICARDGRLTRTLTRIKIPDNIESRVIVENTLKVVYIKQNSQGMHMPVAFLKVPFGLLQFELRPEPRCEYVPLNQFAINVEYIKLLDICALTHSILICLQRGDNNIIVEVDPIMGPIRSINMNDSFTRPKILFYDGIAFISCQGSHRTVEMDINAFAVHRISIEQIEVAENQYVIHDLIDIIDAVPGPEDPDARPVEEEPRPGPSLEELNYPRMLHQHEPLDEAVMQAPNFRPVLLHLPHDPPLPYVKPRTRVHSSNRLEFFHRHSVHMTGPNGVTYFQIDGLPNRVVVGWLPRRLFTVDDACEPLPV